MQNEIIVGRFGQLAARLFGIKGRNPTPQLSPELVLHYDVGRPSPEDRYHLDTRLCCGYITPAAAAAQLGKVLLRNPAGSNVVATLEKLIIGGATAAALYRGFTGALGTDFATLPGPDAVAFRDGRFAGAPSLKLTSDNTGAAGIAGTQNLFTVGVGATSAFVLDPFDVVLTPGEAVQVDCITVNLQWYGTFWWRERALVPSELV